ncbi:porin family protein [Gracilimonas sediminicola]|uniref:PorT family protein n=1 Tax=Gracilimonas sediminicola TaxID=2952158 RepID=A0A9X2L3P7_9BACT|nr:porin family protein [Gracilimonas sediminicola]MCP9291258.1 PorT family protein [Gracilimonas sediminicola]
MKLRQTIIGIVAGVFFVLGSVAQAQVLPKFGVKAGANYSTFNNTDNVEYKAGFVGGIYSSIKVPASPLTIQPEVLYAQYGAGIENSDAWFRVNYLQIPVLLKFGFNTPGVQPNVFFGPYMGINLNSEVKNESGSINLDDQAEGTDFGIAVGAGLDISKFNIGLRYTVGLKDVANDNFNDEAKNGAFALTVGIEF